MIYGSLNYSITRFEIEYAKITLSYNKENEFKRKPSQKELTDKDTFALTDALDFLLGKMKVHLTFNSFHRFKVCTGLVALAIESFCQRIPHISLLDERVIFIITNQLPHFQG